MKLFITLFILFVTMQISPQSLFKSEPDIRVRIINAMDRIEVLFEGVWTINDSMEISKTFDNTSILLEDDKVVLKNSEDIIFSTDDQLTLNSKLENGSMKIKDVPYGVGWWWEGKEDRIYEGEISICQSKDMNLEVIVKLPLEEYLKGVIPYEMGGDSPLESLKAQAVAARSEAVVALRSDLYSGPHHDLTSDVECQVFSGNHKRTQESDRAVAETRGIILSEDGIPIHAYYASNCGGHSELIKNVWPHRSNPQTYQVALSDNSEHQTIDLSSEKAIRDWINSSPEVYCNPNQGTALPGWSQKNFRWQREISMEDISQMVSKGNNFGNLQQINPLKRGLSGRICEAEFVFENEKIMVTGEIKIRQLFSPSLRSAAFITEKTDSSFILKGAGWGHGVGMCQSGAVSQAKQVLGFKSILLHYYPKAEIINLYSEEGQL